MGEIENSRALQEMGHKRNQSGNFQWVLMETKEDVCEYDLIDSDSDDLENSFSSFETIEDVSSSSSSSSNGPLFELSDLMVQLPIKRGLSKFYEGKSESFGSLASVKSIEDLAKKKKFSVSCRSRRSMKSLDGQSQRLSPKATIAKNKNGPSSTITRTSLFSSIGKMSSLMAN